MPTSARLSQRPEPLGGELGVALNWLTPIGVETAPPCLGSGGVGTSKGS